MLIEQEAKKIESNYQSKIAQLKTETEEEINRLVEETKNSIQLFKDESNKEAEEKLNQYKKVLDDSLQLDKERFTAEFDSERDHLIELTIKEVMKRYGNS